jgi:hypothetical protein
MKKVLIISALLIGGVASAQNLNPVVEVTNMYAMEASGIEKPEQLLPLPDSVFKFNLDFDYSVKSTPYKGAYEFNPYLVQMRPSARLSGEHTFYLKAGAGYGFHPEVDVVWNPVRKDNFRLNLYATHNSYMGRYRRITIQENVVDWNREMQADRGVNARTEAGADFLYAFKGGQFSADLQYRNITATDFYTNSEDAGLYSHHKGQFQARVQSNPGTRFLYNVGTRVAYLGYAQVKEFHTVSDASFGIRAGRNNSFRLNLGLETVGFDEGESALKLEVAPHYAISTKRLNLDLGVKYSYISRSDNAYPHKGGILFPDVHFSLRLADAIVLQAAATGGDVLKTYDSLLEDNPFLGGFMWSRDVTVNRVHVMAGLRGSAGARFSYDVRVGYKWSDNACGWSFIPYFAEDGNQEATSYYMPTMAYVSPLHTYYAQATLALNLANWDILGHVYYGNTKPPVKDTPVAENVFAPAGFMAHGHIFYKWAQRIKVGFTIDARGKLKAKRPVPGYQDLGFYGEYTFGRKMAVWVKAGNLLNQTIQRTPFYAEQGIYGSVGIKLTF